MTLVENFDTGAPKSAPVGSGTPIHISVIPADARDWVSSIYGTRSGTASSSDIIPSAFIRWAHELEACEEIEEIIALLRLASFEKAADRIAVLHSEATSDDNEPPLDLGSLKNLATFVKANPDLGQPRIGLGQDGVLTGEWRYADDKHIAIRFLSSSNETVFAAIGPAPRRRRRRRLNGTGSISEIIAQLNAFGLRSWDRP